MYAPGMDLKCPILSPRSISRVYRYCAGDITELKKGRDGIGSAFVFGITPT